MFVLVYLVSFQISFDRLLTELTEPFPLLPLSMHGQSALVVSLSDFGNSAIDFRKKLGTQGWTQTDDLLLASQML